MSAGSEIDCRVRVAHEDFILQNHVVHGVPVMPGVALLDIVFRVLLASGLAVERVTLRDIRFAEPVRTGPGRDRDLRVLVAAGGAVRSIRVDSRWSDQPAGEWQNNVRAELDCTSPVPARRLDLSRFEAAEPHLDAMRRFYDRTRAEGIEHGLPMRCSGARWTSGEELLVGLELDPSATDHEESFHLHPAKMDASTLVAFGQNLEVGSEPFIPFHIEALTAVAPLTRRVLVHVPRPERPTPNADLVRNDYAITDEQGRLLVEVTGMSCKRIRHPELITRLLPAATSAPDRTATADRLRAYLRALIATRTGAAADQLDDAAGFYDLGLESVDLLRIGEELEQLTGSPLYPTLLFEFGTIGSLSAHLAARYDLRLPDPAEPPPATAAEVWCARPCWQPAALGGGRLPGRLRVSGAGDRLLAALAGEHASVHGFDLLTDDPAALDRLAAEAVAGDTGFLHISQADPASEAAEGGLAVAGGLWRLAAAVVRARPPGTVAVLLLTGASPAGRALGALAATISAEVPQLAVRHVEVAPGADLAAVALAELAELADNRAQSAVRSLPSGRLVRRWQRLSGPGLRLPGVEGVTLITGGGGGIAALLVDELVSRPGARIALLGRRPADQALAGRLTRWRAAGAEVSYLVADVADQDQLPAACARIRAELGPIEAVYHCAGEHRDGLFFRRDAADLARVSRAKVAGTIQLDLATAADRLRYFVLFSSLSAVVPNAGQADYAYANAFQLAFAEQRAARPDRTGRTLALAWPFWADGGMALSEAGRARAAERDGLHPLPTRAALEQLAAALAGTDPVLAVLCGDPVRAAGVLPAAEPERTDHADQARSTEADGAIAIIGLAGRYPGGADLDEFWQTLAGGRSAVTEVPAERWDHAAIFDPDPDAPGRTYGRWGGFLDGIDRFDPAFFSISRRDAERMDPQERLFLTTAWHAFENAGYSPTGQSALSVGVFVGVMWNHYQLYTAEDGGVAPTSMHAAIANRVSYCLDLHGPSMAVDTACSSSLTAIHLAVQSLRSGECELALAGGVNLAVHPQKYLQLAQGRFLSDDGRCHSFGAEATGYVPGEGVGAVLLKPLARALADGDHIHGVLHASAVNHTGRTSGFTVPSPAAQASLIRGALDRAGWDPATVGYVEAHGTGTALGDPIEIAGLSQAFAAAPGPACSIGSVKSNIGHAESAAGIAGLTKVLLQLRHAQLAPSLHADPANPHIDFEAAGFRVQRELAGWTPRAGAPLRAGVSAFGAGGANAHLLVEQPPAPPDRTLPAGSDQLVVLSARDEAALRRAARRLLAHLDGRAGAAPDPVLSALAAETGLAPELIGAGDSLSDLGLDAAGVRRLAGTLGRAGISLEDTVAGLGTGRRAEPIELADLAYTLQVGRTALACRLAVRAGDLAELTDRLARFGSDGAADGWWCTGHREPPDRPAEPDPADLDAVAGYWVAGGEVDWAARATPGARRIPLPGYAFADEPFWIGRWQASRTAEPEPRAERVIPAPAGPAAVTVRVLEHGIALVSMQAGHNMFDAELVRRLQDAFAQVAADPAVRAVVLTGTTEVFSMGAAPEGLLALAAGASRFTDHPFMYEGLLRCDRPVVAAMQGHAAGGGFAFGLFADVVVLSRQAMYSANFVSLGFTPGMGATFVLAEQLGSATARELMLTGRPVSGADLERRGATVRIVDSAEVLATALGLARSIAQQNPKAVQLLKRDLADRTLERLGTAIQRESRLHQAVFEPDSVQRIAAHFAKVDGFTGGRSATGAGAEPPAVAEPPAAAEPPAVRPAAATVELAVPASPADDDRLPAPAAVADTIRRVLSDALYLQPAEIEAGATFSELGLDSVGAVELVRDLNRAYGLSLESTTVYDHPTVDRLVAFVCEAMRSERMLLAAATEPGITEPEDDHPEPVPAALPGTVQLPALGSPARPRPAATPPAGQPPIAVIGMSGRFPDAADLGAYWQNLATAHDSVREVPVQRWDTAEFYHPDRREPGRSYSKWAALLDRVDEFDPRFFRMSPLEAAAMDPQQRLFLQTAWATLEDAGYAVHDGPDRRWGVFVGCAAGDYQELIRQAGQDETAHVFLGNSTAVLAARIGYLLDLTGPTMAVDTACSSSLVAIHLACESIRAGDCQAALAGGVALMLTPRMHILTSKAGMLSPTGRCAPFDAGADGIVLGEGVGCVLLKRLDRAVADGDHIHGVILASGMNGDGRTNGITAPSALSQRRLLSRVHELAGVAPADLGYVEAHGTGTPLGDPIELTALAEVVGERAGSAPCLVGSVKGNIGHTTMAAGVAGVLKVLLALQHRSLPPTLNYRAANPDIDFAASGLQPVTERRDWLPGRSGRRIGAVSSFGFSGTNAHLVLAEAPEVPATVSDGAGYLVPVSAHTPAALRQSLAALAAALDRAGPGPALADVAYTLTVGRSHYPCRIAFIASDPASLAAAMKAAELPAAGEVIVLAEHCDPALLELGRRYLAGDQLRWPGRPARRCSLPGHPFAAERHWIPAAAPGREPAAGLAPPEPVVIDDWRAADHLIGGVPVVAAAASLELAIQRIAGAGWAGPRALRSIALLRPVRPAAELSLLLDGDRIELVQDGLPCLRATLDRCGPAPDPVDVDRLVATLGPERSGPALLAAFRAGGIEYGPSFRGVRWVRDDGGQALARIETPAARSAEVADRPLHPAVLDAALQAVAALVGARAGGGPAVPFALRRFQAFAPVPAAGYARAVAAPDGYDVDLLDLDGSVRVRFEGLALRPLPAADRARPSVLVPYWPPAAAAPGAADEPVLIVESGGGTELAAVLSEAYRARGVRVRRDEPAGPSAAELAGASAIRLLVTPAPDASVLSVTGSVLAFVQRLLAARPVRTPLSLVLHTRGAVAVDGTERLAAPVTGLPGLVGSIAAENPHWSVGLVDSALDAPVPAPDQLIAETGADRIVALRNGRRLVRRIRELPLDTAQPPYRRSGVYVVVGGTGGLGRAWCERLAREYAASLVLVGRRPLDRDIQVQLEELRSAGGTPRYHSADVTDAAAIRRVLLDTRREFGVIHGVIHSALVLSDRTLAGLDEPALAEVLAPKTAGALVLGEAARTEHLDFLAYFSSAVSFGDAAGQANYAAASTAEDSFVHQLRQRCRFSVTVLNWGYWGSVGVVADQRYARRLAGFGVAPIAAEDGLAALATVLAHRVPQAIVVAADRDGLAALGAVPMDAASAVPMDAASAVPMDAASAVPMDAASAGLSADATGGEPPVAEAFADLDRAAGTLLYRRLRALGVLPAVGGSCSVRRARQLLRIGDERVRMFDGMLAVLARAGLIRLDADLLTVEAEPAQLDPAALTSDHPDLRPHLTLLQHAVESLPAVLDGSRPGVAVLFGPGYAELVEQIYRGHPSADHHHRLMAAELLAAARQAHRRGAPALRVLEVGAGTGAGTGFALRACRDAPLPVEYTFTDISGAFLRRARDAFGSQYPELSYELLDIEADPAEQGFVPESYDVLLATNVLHATAGIRATLGNVARLLRPGGLALINEVTRADAFTTLTFGLTPGWWRYRDPELREPHSPLLRPASWHAVLAETGFGPVRTLGLPGLPDVQRSQCVFAATAPESRPAPAGDGALAGREYVRTVFAEVLRFEPEQLDYAVTFENFGVDSLVSLDILARFERDLGPLPATLLFEQPTLAELADHLMRTTGLAEQLPQVATAVPARQVEPVPSLASTDAAATEIAVVGMAGRYPGAPDIDALWSLLRRGGSGITEVPADRWEWRHYVAADAVSQAGRWGGFLDAIDEFDPAFFGILAREAADIDPQERLFLETAYTLLEEAGYLGERTHVPDTGVFAGTMYGSYGQLAATGWAAGRLTGATSAYWSIANRVSYALDLHGPSFAVDAACSSSLLAVHLACESLRRGECSMAVAGGVNLILHPSHLQSLAALTMLAADGRCKAFDERADGFVPGEGVGAVLLKPLPAALADRDRIWGVLRGGSMNAGGKTGGYTVPNPAAQAALIRAALARAGVAPETIGYLEAHGTGTQLGDPIELRALERALGTAGQTAIGSIKANLGHLEGAAGIAGLTRALLQLRHAEIAPCAELATLNPKIELAGDRFRFARQLEPWPAGSHPRRAGVSSFGAGGANVHLVLEEAPACQPRRLPVQPDGEVFVLSARTASQLRAYADRVAAFLADSPDGLVELCHTSQVGRRTLPRRLAVRCHSVAELADRLAAFGQGRPVPGVWSGGTGPDGAGDVAADWAAGAEVDWLGLRGGVLPDRVSFPGCPFERTRHWLALPEPGQPAGALGPTSSDPELPPDGGWPAGVRLEVPAWQDEPSPAGGSLPRRVLLIADRDGPLPAALASTGCDVLRQRPDGVEVEACDRFVAALAGQGTLPDAVLIVREPTVPLTSAELPGELDRGLHLLVQLATALLRRQPRSPLRLLYCYPHTAGPDEPQHAAVAAALRTLALEHSGVSGATVGLGPDPAAAVLAELAAAPGVVEVRHTAAGRQCRRLVGGSLANVADYRLPAGGTVLITGGAGALGLLVAEHLAATSTRPRLLLAGRSEPGPAVRSRLAGIADTGATVSFHRCDVADPAQLAELVRRCGELTGVIHAAGTIADARAVHKSAEQMAGVLAPKVAGVLALDEATSDHRLDFFTVFSSVVAETGNLGQLDYAAAGGFLAGFVLRRQAQVRAGRRWGHSTAIEWPLWQDGGMPLDEPTRRRLARSAGMAPMPTATALRIFDRAVTGPYPVLAAWQQAGAQATEAIPDNAETSGGDATEAVRHRLRQFAADFLLVDPAEVSMTDDLLDTGFDSITLTELINQVNDTYDLDLLPTVLFECATLGQFAERLSSSWPEAVRRVESAPAGRPAIADQVLAAAPAAVPEPVAIVGLAGSFPGAPDAWQFWQQLAAGADLIGAPPADRLELLAADPAIRGGFLDGIGEFDAAHFRISAAEAALMDPQQRIFLQAVWHAIEDSGHRPAELAGTSTGLFVGVSTTDYADLLGAAGVPVVAHTASGIAHSILANRISHLLDLRGPSEAVDTACSSSLVAIHRAVQAIAAGECRLALAGGVNALLSPGLFSAFGQSGMLSPSAACQPFAAAADGYLRGEGVGAIVLKPLSTARADGDQIYAVVRASAEGHGGRTASLTAPSSRAQADVLLAAYRRGGIDPAAVTAIEAHGTGTKLGDPVEFEGLVTAFAELAAEHGAELVPGGIALGSVKSNIGHLEAASGIAGVVKMLLAMRHGYLPASRNCTPVNPMVRIAGSPFQLAEQGRPWPTGPRGTRTCGVSSFGFGGVNSHLVLESAPDQPRAPGADRPSLARLIVLSHDDPALLAEWAATLAGQLGAEPGLALDALAYTLQVGRDPREHRLVLVAGDSATAAAALRAAGRGEPSAQLIGKENLDAQQHQLGGDADLVRSWLAGADVDWAAGWAGAEPGRIPVPPRPFRRRAYWFDGRAELPMTELPMTELPMTELPMTGLPKASASPERAGRRQRAKLRLEPLAAVPEPVPVAAPVPVVVSRPTPPAEEAPAIAATVRRLVAEVLELDLAEPGFGLDAELADLGLDSIYRLELARRLNREFGLALQGADLYEFPTLARLADWVQAAVAGAQPATAAAEPTEPAEPAEPTEPAEPAELAELAALLAEDLAGPLDQAVSFDAAGLTSFDMLRAISALERRFGTLPKSLLFDHPTVPALHAELVARFGAQGVRQGLAGRPAEPAGRTQPAAEVRPGEPDPDCEVLVLRKRALTAAAAEAGWLRAIDEQWAKEGGLAGRDIAPLAFLGCGRQAYFNFSRRGEDIFAWSYAGSAENFPLLAAQWIRYARRNRLRPNLLAMVPLDQVGGVPLTATPFGAVQRLPELASFSLQGTKMQRLRSQLHRFARGGPCRTEEYRPGSDPAVDASVAAMVDRWSAQKRMVNPYVGIVRDELAAGQLADRHRMFLTWSSGALANVVIITRIPSENGWLLDLEFYPADPPSGGLEYAIVSILDTLRDEGATLFSFGASFGVRICSSANPAPEVAAGLHELEQAGIFGAGNFTFKNKFRPVNEPLYLCQLAGERRTSLADIILMIAEPDLAAGAPGLAGNDEPGRTGSDDSDARSAALRRCAYNPLALPAEEIEIELLTDSWAELDTEATRQGRQRLRAALDRGADRGLPELPGWLPFGTLDYATSGRAAERLLSRAWPGARGFVVHNGVFPTWSAALAEAGFVLRRTRTAADRRPRGDELFQGDLDLPAFAEQLNQTNGGTSFIGIELGANAGGGYPISLGNLRAVRELAERRGIPVVLDATRVVENAVFIAEHEDRFRGRPVPELVRELLGLADAATLSLSKDFAVDGGGLLVSRVPELSANLALHRAARGQETTRDLRRQLAVAISDLQPVEAAVRERLAAVAALHRALASAGLPVLSPAAAHAVLLDAAAVPELRGTAEPVASLLAWLYHAAGVRGGPHLDSPADGRAPDSYLRLAVPVGTTVAQAAAAGRRIAAGWSARSPIDGLVEVLDGQPAASVAARYHPTAELPTDVEDALRTGYRPHDDNAAVLALSGVDVAGTVLEIDGAPVEVFTAGHGSPLVLMHPFNIGAGAFLRQFAALAGRYRLICMHHPGVGATRWKADLTLPGIADLYARVLAELRVAGPAHVLGSSFGGLVAQSFALRHRDRCASLVLVGSSYKVGNRRGEVNRLSVVAAEDFDRVLAHPDGALVDRAELEPLLLRCESMDPQTGLNYLDVFATEPTLLQQLPEIAVGTLVVHGGCDTVISPRTAHVLFGAIPAAVHAEIPGAGHFPCLTHPDQVHRLLLPFLDEQAAPAVEHR